MKKQEFLDKHPKTWYEGNILQLMLGMSKTQLLTLHRHLKMAQKTLYSSEMRKATLGDLIGQVEAAHAFLDEKENNGQNPVEENRP